MTATVTSKRTVFRTIAEHPDYHWPYYRLPETSVVSINMVVTQCLGSSPPRVAESGEGVR